MFQLNFFFHTKCVITLCTDTTNADVGCRISLIMYTSASSLTERFSPSISRVHVDIRSPEISWAALQTAIPWYLHLYTFPFLSLYPLLAYAYYVKYDDWLQSEEWTFLACVSLGAGHALSFLTTKWSTAVRAWITTSNVCAKKSAIVEMRSPFLGEYTTSRRLHTNCACTTQREGRNRSLEQEESI